MKRVLVVEDEIAIRDSFARFLRNQGYDTDEASDYNQAVERLESRTYHVALIDVMLAGPDRSNRDGLKVVEYVRQLNEGTKSVVISQQEDPQLAADTLQNQGVYRYVTKVRIEQEGLEVLLDVVSKASAEVNLNLFGWAPGQKSKDRRPQSALSYLGGGEKMIIAFSRWSEMFGPSVSPVLLEDAIDEIFPQWAPILPLQDTVEYLVSKTDPVCLTGTFWSKSAGFAVTLVVCAEPALSRILNGQLDPKVCAANEIYPQARFGRRSLIGLAFRRDDLNRAQFAVPAGARLVS